MQKQEKKKHNRTLKIMMNMKVSAETNKVKFPSTLANDHFISFLL